MSVRTSAAAAALLTLVTLGAAPAAGSAQAAASAQAMESTPARGAVAFEPSLRLATAYEGRGLTFHDGLAGQVTADVVLRAAGADIRAGAWSNIELVRQGGAPTMLADAVPGLSEVNLYLSASRSLAGVDLTTGWIYFLWPTGFDFSDAGPLQELFVALDAPLAGGDLGVGAAAYYDFAARGTYGEVSAGARLPWVRGTAPELTVELAWILGQEEYYTRADGLTHVGVTLGWSLTGHWTRLRPELCWTLALDPATRTGALREGGRQKVHLGLVVTPR